ncbi:serine hydrolase domain-containing protein [Corynebacterium glyciniphilum]|uniref:serine hydrolase domain-containing protein n=1 Tax=Corynebacterium glyciniphilum TaxID=1404244 RepID=UPI0011AB7318|nr:serine hydrolase domain-containing protein [Corynebacterium glyciniphilum]
MDNTEIINALAALLRERVTAGCLPGAVVAHLRADGDTDTVAVGVQDLESGTPMSEESLFFWDSLGKPVVAALGLTFIAEGTVDLDSPVARWLPELADPRVLRDPTGPVEDTVPADRPVTVEDLLTLRGGLGFIPDFEAPYSVRLVDDLQEGRHRALTRQEYLTAAAGLPLAHHPGDGWTYNTGSTLLGLLLERVADRPLEELMQERLLGPLGMVDMTWWVDTADTDRRARFTARYAEQDGQDTPVLVDGVDGIHAEPPSFPDGAGALIGPVGDWVTFARMLLGGGASDGVRVLPEPLVAAMMTDQLSPAQREMSGFFLTDGEGWGYGGSVRPDGTYGWAGAAGTWARVNPRTDEAVVVFTQLALHGPDGGGLFDEIEQIVSAAW